MQDTLQSLQGKTILIEKLTADFLPNGIELHITGEVQKTSVEITLYSVHNLTLRNLSFPAIIEGLFIIDNTSKGWESSSRYEIGDYEENVIHCFCKDITILPSSHSVIENA